MTSSSKPSKPVLHPELQSLLGKIREKRKFDPDSWVNEKCKLFNSYMKDHRLSGCVVNLSGGVDSAVTLGLMKKSSEMKDSPIKKIVAISQPIHSSDWAFNRANEAAKVFNVKLLTIDQTSLFDNLKLLVNDKMDKLDVIKGDKNSGQLRSYMRTPVVYYVAQLLSFNGYPAVVIGTGNKDEDGYLAYFCKAGDGVCDIQLINDLHKSEVFKVGKVLNVPKSILTAAPSADLWSGQTDEDELGFTYDFIEFWINYIKLSENEQNKIKNNISSDALKQLNEWGKLAQKIHLRNKHKLNFPVNINSTKLN